VDLPRAVAQWTSEQYRSVRAKPENYLWVNEGRGFAVEMLHSGSVYQTPVSIYSAEDDLMREQRFLPAQFDYGTVPPPDGMTQYSGFRIHSALNRSDALDPVLQFHAGTLFRSLAKGQNFGLFARGLVLKIGEATGEEFPLFQQFWIERPAIGANALVIHALLDTESVVGLYRFAFRPGDTSLCDIEVTLLPRVDLAHVGLGPLSGSFFFGANDRTGVDDFRPSVHDVQGLQMLSGQNEWIWRPLHNPETLQFSSFIDSNPKGFGLVQRDRRFETFADLDNRFERRPSAWIEPLGEWGAGHVQLVEIPSRDETNRNVIAYWRPRAPLPRAQEHFFSYRIHWCWAPPEKPPGAQTVATRIGRSYQSDRRRRFAVDFSGDAVDLPEKTRDITINLSNSRGKIVSVAGRSNPDVKGYRVGFELDPENNSLIELRLLLEKDGKPLSETWLYRWTP
jgi:glucans biosynthesis protein